MPLHARAHPGAKAEAGVPAISTKASSQQALGTSSQEDVLSTAFSSLQAEGECLGKVERLYHANQ